MKKAIILVFCCLLTAGVADAQQRVNYSSLTRIGRICYYEGVPFTGVALGYADNTGDPTTIDYKEGRANGWLTGYHDHARTSVKWSVPMVNGKQHGVYTSYDEDGSLQFTAKRVRGKLEGKRRCYNSDGSLWHIHRYRCGKQNGVMFTFNPDGSLYVKKQYRNDTLNGMCRMYLDDGSREKGRFLNGERNGIWKIYDADGKLLKKIRFEKGQQMQ